MTAVLEEPIVAATRPAGPPTPKFKLIDSQTLFLPREKAVQAARAHQDLPRSPTEREQDPHRLAELIERIKGGVWLPCNWAVVRYERTKYRMNGQHSSQAILDAAEFLPEQLAIHIDQYEAADREQMAMLFRQFDARISSRSKADVAGAYQGLVHELDDIRREVAKIGVEGAVWYDRMVEGLATASGDQLYQMFFSPKYHAFLHWLAKILEPWKKVSEVRKAPVIAAAYRTFILSESGAREFWPHVSRPDLPDDTDARLVLSQELNRLNEKNAPTKVKPLELYLKCGKAWNAFRGGEKIPSRTLNVNLKKGLFEFAA